MHQRVAQELQAFPGRDASLEEADRLRREIDALRNRLTRMSEASLRINESLNLPTLVLKLLRTFNGGCMALAGWRRRSHA